MTSADGNSAYATVQRGGTDHIYRVALSGAEAFEAVTSGDSVDFPLDLRGDNLLYARTTLEFSARSAPGRSRQRLIATADAAQRRLPGRD